MQEDKATILPLQGEQRGKPDMGNAFLYYVAQDLIGRYGNNLSEVTIVFPGKRAELYMNSFLSHIAQGPVWAPRFITIDELFQQFSNLTPCDTILCVCRLYRIYASLVPHPQTLDDFYGWGEILMNDFGDIDKHLVDADKLFANGADLAALEQTDFLSESQIETLRQFFANFEPDHQTELKQRFLEMWKAMPEMYHRLKEELRKDGLMYKGGIYREVAEKMKNLGGEEREESSILNPQSSILNPQSSILNPQSSILNSQSSILNPQSLSSLYCFVGFNVLDEVEETLFAYLRDAGRALFYWDYDVYYTKQAADHEAGLFMRHNLEHYPCALSDDIYDNLSNPDKRIRLMATSTDNAQVRYLPQWITAEDGRTGKDTAIVLCDEALMRPAMHAIPDTETVNITMGFPLTDTAVHGYFSALFDLQIEGWDDDQQHFRPTAIERVEKNAFFPSFPQDQLPLQHPTDNLQLTDWLIAAIEALGKHLGQSHSMAMQELYAESTFQLYRTLTQFRWLIADGTLNVRPATLRRLVRQALATATIPFHGEMDEGIQVMGLLEARNLDFHHLIMLSVGEGIIPSRSNDTSLIPYILRAHFGLDTTERQDAVYAYSFYRLLQRAQDITLVYNDNSSGVSQREQSRFLRQLLTETDLPIEQTTVTLRSPIATRPTIIVEKDSRIMDKLYRKKSLSPTAINQYIDCPLRFYYQQVAYIHMPDRPQDGIDARHFGTIFHDTCEHFYDQLAQATGRRQVLRSDLEPFVLHPSPFTLLPSPLAPFIDWAFENNKFQSHSGINLIIREVIQKLVEQQLRWDMEHTPFTIYEMEKDHFMDITVHCGDRDITLKTGGRIDRMDIMQIGGRETLRVLDYKTGRAKTGPTNIEGIFDGSAHNAHGYYLQTFLYAVIMAREQPLPVCPALFYILSATDAIHYSPLLKLDKNDVTDISELADPYLEGLRRAIAEIYDPTRPFTQTDDTEKQCLYCDFRRLCGR